MVVCQAQITHLMLSLKTFHQIGLGGVFGAVAPFLLTQKGLNPILFPARTELVPIKGLSGTWVSGSLLWHEKTNSLSHNELPRSKLRGINPCPPFLWRTCPPLAD